MTANRPSTRPQTRSARPREQLMDTAEDLFAQRGYFAASVRDITQAAGLRLASVNYYFGSKEGLLGEVVRRRAAVLRDDRLASLTAALQAPGGEDPLTAIVRAFVAPMIAQCVKGGEPWKRYFILIAQLATMPSAAPPGGLEDFDDVAGAYVAAFRSLSPKITAFAAHATFQFMLGVSLFVVCDSRRLDHLSAGRFHSADLEALTEPLVEFLGGGAAASLGLAG